MRDIIFLILASVVCGCSSKAPAESEDGGENESATWMNTEDVMLPVGMSAEKVAALPGVRWISDTLRGVCAPDTIIIWADYDGAQYLTNVYGIGERPIKELKLSGKDKAENGLTDELKGADFKSTAMIVENPYGSVERLLEVKACDYRRKTDEMADMVKGFFTSNGSSEYMRGSLAAIWNREYAEAKEYGENINPFNNGYYSEFVSGTLKAKVTDASKGIVEVEAYASDPYTLGYPGWTYWTVAVCAEGSGFKIKELPALHRKFEKTED